MRIKVSFISDTYKNIVLPKGFGSILQGFIYKYIINKNQQWLHDSGFIHEKGQRFKLFVFSSILEKGKFDKKNELFYFPEKISILISSPVEWILENFASNVIKEDKFYLYKNDLKISSVEVFKGVTISNNTVDIKMLTPVEVHTTLDRIINIMEKEYHEIGYREKSFKKGKVTKYFSPFDDEFSKRVCENLKKKWEVFYNKKCDFNINIEPLFSEQDYLKNKRYYKRVVLFGRGKKATIINGWMGRYKLTGDSELINFSYDAGIGSRNSQGFGMWDFA